MIIAVIGQGVVGKAFSSHLQEIGHTVLPVDINTELTIVEAAAQADAVFIFTLPIQEVHLLIEAVTAIMRPGTLLVHGTSIANPRTGSIDPTTATSKGLTFAHLHIHFRPEVPLSQTMAGKHVTLSMVGELEPWKTWLETELLLPYQPILHPVSTEEHDSLTQISQLVHMSVAVLVATIWQEYPTDIVQKGLEIGGLPAQLLKQSVERTASNADVASQILTAHPHSLELLDSLEASVAKMRQEIKNNNPEALADILKSAIKSD